MANDIQISVVTGLTITLQIYSGAATVGASFIATEIGTTGEYVANMPAGIPYGLYMVLATVAAGKIGSGQIFWDGDYELINSLSKLEGLDGSNPMTVTPTTRVTGDIDLAITGDGETSTVVTRI